MKIYNAFSETPTRNFTAAGIDFYVPNISDYSKEANAAVQAIKQSYKVTDTDIENLITMINDCADASKVSSFDGNYLNIIHLYYGLNDKVRYFMRQGDVPEQECVQYFLDNVLTFDSNGKPGVICKFSDMLFINSGIKVALEPHTCMEFKEKSGKGMQGWTVKAKLIDEDYSGYVHLNVQYLWWDDKKGTVYVGDKLTQGVVYPVLTDNAEEISTEEYDKIMSSSNRGADAFGSSDVKH